MKPLVILPTYNERENIARLIPEILAADTRLHILVVDDSSPDGTGSAVEELRVRGFLSGCFWKPVPAGWVWAPPTSTVSGGALPMDMIS